MILGVVAGAAASVWDSGTTDRARGLIPLIPIRTPRARPTLEQIVGALTDLSRQNDENYRRLLAALNNVYGRLMTSVKYPWPLSWFVLWRIEKKIEREMLAEQAALQAARAPGGS
jgi:hypothetical protein